ncbi:hypothetical protein C8R44DRAFT_800771 [Mycena epipterygia]|nr:hypothetical protein C8R44DRAFT_800771 [Mycena epipterygia]
MVIWRCAGCSLPSWSLLAIESKHILMELDAPPDPTLVRLGWIFPTQHHVNSNVPGASSDPQHQHHSLSILSSNVAPRILKECHGRPREKCQQAAVADPSPLAD